jgi:transposase
LIRAAVALSPSGVTNYALKHGARHRPWLASLLNRRPTKVAAIALANKLARMARAMMANDERYKEPVALAR